MRKLIPVTALMAAFFALPVVHAQQGGQMPPQTAPQQAPIQVDDQTVADFASALSEIQGIQQDFSQKLQNVEDQEKARELQQQAQEQMVAAVERNDLSVNEYNQVAQAMSRDQQLRERIMSQLN